MTFPIITPDIKEPLKDLKKQITKQNIDQKGTFDLISAAELDAATAQKRRLMAEIKELEHQKKWQDILTLAYPLEEKYPFLVELELDIELRKKIGFALVRCSMHQKALNLLLPLLKQEPENFKISYAVAYAAYDALYMHKNKQLALSQKEKQNLLQLAHQYFKKCVNLKPDTVTVNYRLGMLYKEFEDKPRKAIPMFKKAILNWDRMTISEREKRHQERPKFIKSLYHLAACFVKLSLPSNSLKLLKRLLKEDEATNFIKPVFKYFALGKTFYALNQFKEALEYLYTASAVAEGKRAPDYVIELTAGCLLMLNKPEKALAEIDRITLKYMRPYVRWRRSDILVALKKHEEALRTLEEGLDKDGISRHKTFLRIARIHYSMREYDKAISAAEKAAQFYQKKFGNELKDAAFVQAVSLLGLKEACNAKMLLENLLKQGYSCPGFRKALLTAQKECSDLKKEALKCKNKNLIH